MPDAADRCARAGDQVFPRQISGIDSIASVRSLCSERNVMTGGTTEWHITSYDLCIGLAESQEYTIAHTMPTRRMVIFKHRGHVELRCSACEWKLPTPVFHAAKGPSKHAKAVFDSHDCSYYPKSNSNGT
jgi:hypothetical protein